MEGGGGGWRIIGQSVQGSSHLRKGLPNQDAIAWLPAAGVGPPLALAVSDGHGDRRCFRSDVGARLAVETGSHLLMEFLDCPFDPNNLSLIKHTAEDRLSEGLVRSWRQEVEKHLAENPFRQEEWDFLREKVGEEARSAIENDPFLAYGATLLLAAVTETYLLCMQLGDGDILAMDAAGVAGRLVAKDERLIGNETFSLCMREAWNGIHVELIPFRQAPPALVLISTDGYSNSYASEEGFLQTGPDYLRMIRSEGIEAVQQKLQGFLEETSRKGSGDDITLGMIKRSEKQDWDCFNLRLSSLERDIAAKASIEQLVSSRAEEDEKRAEGSARNEKHLEDTSEDLRELIKTQAEHNNEINQKLANTQAFLQVIDRKSRSLTRWVLIAALISLVSIGLIIYLLLR